MFYWHYENIKNWSKLETDWPLPLPQVVNYGSEGFGSYHGGRKEVDIQFAFQSESGRVVSIVTNMSQNI